MRCLTMLALILCPVCLSADETIQMIKGKAPEFPSKAKWLYPEKEVRLSQLKEKVVVVHFWSLHSSSSMYNMDTLRQWMDEFDSKKFQVLNVHSPVPDEEPIPVTRITNLVPVRSKYTLPILFDSDGSVAEQWEIKHVPTILVIDKKGDKRFSYEGQINWKRTTTAEEMGKKIQALLREK